MSGNVRRLTALAILCLAAAPAAVQARNTAAPTVNVSAGLNTASFTIQTASPSRVIVSVGTSTQMVDKTINTYSTSRTVTISPLAPNVKYRYVVKAITREGVASSKPGSFSTSQWSGQPRLMANGRRFTLNGVRYYPVWAMVFNECPSQQVVAADAAMGVDGLYHSTWYGCPDENHDVQWEAADALHGLLDGQVGWIQAGSRTGINSVQPPSWDSLPELISEQGTFRIEGTPTHQVGTVVTDLPTLTDCDAPANSVAALAQDLGKQTAAQAVVFDTFLTRTIGTNPNCLTAQLMVPDFWIPVLKKAAGTEYQTQQNALPSDGVIVDGSVSAAAGLQKKKLDTLYPVIFGGKPISVTSNNDGVLAGAWSWGGGTYVVALNLGGNAVSTTLKVGSSAQKAKVMWEHRGTSVTKGSLGDSFGPYVLHVYKLAG